MVNDSNRQIIKGILKLKFVKIAFFIAANTKSVSLNQKRRRKVFKVGGGSTLTKYILKLDNK